VPNDLSFMYGLRRRVQLNGRGPRALAIAGNRAFVAGYFSDSLDVIDLSAGTLAAETVALNPGQKLTNLRRGEMYFNDATICFRAGKAAPVATTTTRAWTASTGICSTTASAIQRIPRAWFYPTDTAGHEPGRPIHRPNCSSEWHSELPGSRVA